MDGLASEWDEREDKKKIKKAMSFLMLDKESWICVCILSTPVQTLAFSDTTPCLRE